MHSESRVSEWNCLTEHMMMRFHLPMTSVSSLISPESRTYAINSSNPLKLELIPPPSGWQKIKISSQKLSTAFKKLSFWTLIVGKLIKFELIFLLEVCKLLPSSSFNWRNFLQLINTLINILWFVSLSFVNLKVKS